MKRALRITLELLGPALIGSFLIFAYVGMIGIFANPGKNGVGSVSIREILPWAAMILVIAYMTVGIQSILYTVIMEWRFREGLDPRSWRSVGLSSFLGFCSGAVLTLVIAKRSPISEVFMEILVLGGLGTTVGFVLGLLIKVCSRGSKRANGDSP